MILWVNRLYPKKNAARAVQAQPGTGGETNLYYTLPVTQNETNTKRVYHVNEQSVYNRSVSSVNSSENRVNTVKNENAQTSENSQVVYQTNVQVDMVNHNQIHGEQDMLRLVQYLREALEACLVSSAEGVM